MPNWKSEEDGIVKVRTCAWSPPGDHPVGCGLILRIEDGKVVKVEGDPDHPISQGRLCPRCLALPEVMYHKDRILHPMVRAKEDRGKDAWKEISWDEALDLIEEKVNWIKEKWGPESILVMQGTGREATLYAPAFGPAVLGTPNDGFTMSGYSCYGPRCAVADFILGAGYPELDYAAFFPDRYDDPRYKVPEYIMVWGKNPLYSNPDGFFGHSIIDLKKRGSRFIVVDPRVTWLATRADYHLQLRPGTDAAVGLGLLNVIINEDLYDHDFVEKWCFGFDDLKERVQEYSPERVEAISWVPAAILHDAARAFAKAKPASVLWGLALDTAANGVQAGHTVIDLIAITGNLDVPGGVTLAVPESFMGKWRHDCGAMIPQELRDRRIVEPQYKGFRAAMGACHPDSVFNTLQTKEPYPFKMAWFFGTNPLANTTYAEPHVWFDALNELEFNVVQDIFMTPTAMGLCDLFLPLTTTAEHDGVVLPHFGRNTHMLAAMNKAVEVGDCKSDLEILIWLGKRLNPEAWPWDTAAEFFTDQIKPKLGFTFEELQEQGVYQQKFEYYKYEKGLLRPDGEPGFNTPTGLVELKSSLYKQWDEDPLPYYEEPYYSPFNPDHPEWKEQYPLILTTGGRSIAMFHSEHRQVPSMRQINPWPLVEIHPDTAAEYGIEEGDWVAIENELGRAVEKAHLTETIKPRVVHCQHGWWFPEQKAEAPNLFGVWKSSVNSMIPNNRTGKLGYGANYKSVICRISKVDSLDG